MRRNPIWRCHGASLLCTTRQAMLRLSRHGIVATWTACHVCHVVHGRPVDFGDALVVVVGSVAGITEKKRDVLDPHQQAR